MRETCLAVAHKFGGGGHRRMGIGGGVPLVQERCVHELFGGRMLGARDCRVRSLAERAVCKHPLEGSDGCGPRVPIAPAKKVS